MKRPNILIIICDQHNVDAISAYKEYYREQAWGPHWVHTPNLDRMIHHGTSFVQCNSNNPVCGPARSTIFTGKMSTETGVTFNNVGIDDDVPNMGQWLQEHSDYNRYYCGKWHGGGPWNYPHMSGSRKIPGFETIPVGHGGTGDFIDYQVSHGVKAFLSNYDEEAPFLVVAGLMNPHDICFWTPGLFGDKAVSGTDYFGLNGRLPVLPPNHHVHYPEWSNGPTLEFSDMEWRNYAYDYYRMVEKMDADVGRMLDAVDARRDDTIVIFTSDHGEGLGRHSRVQKWHPFEESVRVPLLFYGPGIVEEGRIDALQLVSHVDIMPTVCDYAGVHSPEGTRGYSLRSLIETGQSAIALPDHIYTEFGLTGKIIRTGRFKYVKQYEKSGKRFQPYIDKTTNTPSAWVPGIGSQQFVERDEKLLFDLEVDPWEVTNLAYDPDYAEVMVRHEQLLINWENKLVPGEAFTRV
jgi:choline-sulfatase